MANPLLRTFTRISRFSPSRSRPADSCLRNVPAVHACERERQLRKRDPPARVRTLTLLLRQQIHGESINIRSSQRSIR